MTLQAGAGTRAAPESGGRGRQAGPTPSTSTIPRPARWSPRSRAAVRRRWTPPCRRARRAYRRDVAAPHGPRAGPLLFACARVVREHADELAALETLEMGKPYRQLAQFDVQFCINSFEFYRRPGRQGAGPRLRPRARSTATRCTSPTASSAGSSRSTGRRSTPRPRRAPALAAGQHRRPQAPGAGRRSRSCASSSCCRRCCRPTCCRSSPARARRRERRWPAHPLRRAAVVHRLHRHRPGGAQAGGGRPDAGPFELGGKNPMVVFDDADLDAAVRAASSKAPSSTRARPAPRPRGCSSHESRYDERARAARRRRPRLRVGDGRDPGTHVGPHDHVRPDRGASSATSKRAVAEGRNRRCARRRSRSEDRLAGGYWVAPTLFTDVTPTCAIVQEEIFGPVSAVLRFSDERGAGAGQRHRLRPGVGRLHRRPTPAARRVAGGIGPAS